MKKLVCIALVLSFVFAALPVMAGDQGRYVIVRPTDSKVPGLLIDSQTGKAWAVVVNTNWKENKAPQIYMMPIPYDTRPKANLGDVRGFKYTPGQN
ncbi:MAG: hypothetical protein KQI62_05645 [Deltaproteobacteria bacterium]|nr:hypothetical protein [Deltaproteobacteria bacterium]